MNPPHQEKEKRLTLSLKKPQKQHKSKIKLFKHKLFIKCK